ncbi:COG4315 family predicted lipoprotein [Actinacidiphila sp. ITFR-21]|uniref:COG4315 family predicted lipoprotein n=1 Tax=Actinacidiphila sp. ITFR-21 TaxID=3075199 RepID=UPI00288ABEE3|nr:hypothetical protein [Streptomyces sp. ITFR-21]WNI19440.1 hypothetical protein RLT57_30440 [Streptomyces sp. ITFR-21]
MKRTATAVGWSAAALLLASAMSGCSSTGKDSSSAATPAASANEVADTAAGYVGGTSSASGSSNTRQATVSTKSVGKLGTILVDGKGRTLYLFKGDTQKNTSTCDGPCAVAWPPLFTSGKAKVEQQAKEVLLGTAKRSGGTEVTYDGHPLYYFAGDSKSGQANGQGLNQFGALWYVLDPAGKQVTKSN